MCVHRYGAEPRVCDQDERHASMRCLACEFNCRPLVSANIHNSENVALACIHEVGDPIARVKEHNSRSKDLQMLHERAGDRSTESSAGGSAAHSTIGQQFHRVIKCGPINTAEGGAQALDEHGEGLV